MTRIINVLGNSGAGKTFLSLNLGLALNHAGADVILVDANLYSPDIANYSDISPSYFLNEFIMGERKIDDIITKHPSGMSIIPSMMEDEYIPEKHHKIDHALLSLIGKSEIVLIDNFSQNPALFSHLRNADDAVFITNDDVHSIFKAKEFIRKLENKGMTIFGVVLNKKRDNTNRKHLEAILGKRIIAEIPYDEKVIESVNIRQPLFLRYPNSQITKELKEMANIMDFRRR